MEPWTLENESAKWSNWKIPAIFFFLSSIEGQKQWRWPETFAPCNGDNTIGESMARKWFPHFKENCFHISDTPHLGRPSGFDEDRLNTLI